MVEPAGHQTLQSTAEDTSVKTCSRFSTLFRPENAYFVANTSAARISGFLVRALRLTRKITASENPACLNSFRKASPSFAPAIHANQSASLA